VPGGIGGGGGGAGATPTPLAPGNTVGSEVFPRTDAPAAASAAPASGGTGGGARGGMPMMPMMPMGGAQGQGGDADHKSRSRVVGDPQDIFGKPAKASTPVLGDDED
jgi:hypothetical protein